MEFEVELTVARACARAASRLGAAGACAVMSCDASERAWRLALFCCGSDREAREAVESARESMKRGEEEKDEKREGFREAIEMAARGESARALGVLETTTTTTATRGEAFWMARSMVHEMAGNWSEALESLKEVGSAEARMSEGRVMLEKGLAKEGAERLEKVLETRGEELDERTRRRLRAKVLVLRAERRRRQEKRE